MRRARPRLRSPLLAPVCESVRTEGKTVQCGSGATRRVAGGDGWRCGGVVRERRGAGPERRSIPPSVRASFHGLPLPFRYAT